MKVEDEGHFGGPEQDEDGEDLSGDAALAWLESLESAEGFWDPEAWLDQYAATTDPDEIPVWLLNADADEAETDEDDLDDLGLEWQDLDLIG